MELYAKLINLHMTRSGHWDRMLLGNKLRAELGKKMAQITSSVFDDADEFGSCMAPTEEKTIQFEACG